MTDTVQRPSRRFEQVLICSGHMIDAPDRERPRFPEAKAKAVGAAIARQLEVWQAGADDLAICGGASGADTLFAEESLRRGAKLRLLLAQTTDDFVRESVQPAGAEWVRRFEALAQKAEVANLPAAAPNEDGERSIYERVNLWIIESAMREAADPACIRAVLVWDEQPAGDGAGGTADFATRVRDIGGAVAIINPTTIAADHGNI